ncbi:UNVERIFIED_CONTAM: hypothetical protein GTU68_066642 [Idotea baltica]|nr:hypothetical protein [Idotea baltica]
MCAIYSTGNEGVVLENAERPLGFQIEFAGAAVPDTADVSGRFVRLEKIDPARHGPQIWAHIQNHPQVWDYLYEEVPADEATFIATLEVSAARSDWFGYAICMEGGAVGYAFYLNIVPAMGSIEVGNINFSPKMQRTPAASEAMYLMMRQAFDLGYRRYEWKCNALNTPSRRAAQRLGFSWEGIFRQHLIVKGRNRDTAWFAMTDHEWPEICVAFETWLEAGNFDDQGRQRQSLSALTAPHLFASDPGQTG